MTGEEFLDLLARLRRAWVGNVRAPHKPLLLLWLFGRFAASGSTMAAYAEAEEPVSTPWRCRGTVAHKYRTA